MSKKDLPFRIPDFLFLVVLVSLSHCDPRDPEDSSVTTDLPQPQNVQEQGLAELPPARSGAEVPLAKAGVLDLRRWNFETRGPVELNGEWQFHWSSHKLLSTEAGSQPSPVATVAPGQLPGQGHRPSSSNSLSPNSGEWIYVPSEWNRRNEEMGGPLPGQGFATYSLTVLLPPGMDSGQLFLEQTVALSSFRAFLNGIPFARAGSPGTSSSTTQPGHAWFLSPLPGGHNRLHIEYQVSNFHHRAGGLSDNLTLGLARDMMKRQARQRFLRFMLFGAVLVMGIYHLSLFSFRKEDLPALLFGLFCMVLAFRVLVTGEIFLAKLWPSIPWQWTRAMDYISFYLITPLFGSFIAILYGGRFTRAIIWTLSCLSAGFVATTVFLPSLVFTRFVNYYQIVAVILALYTIFVMGRAAFQGRREARIGLIGIVILIVTFINDLLYANNVLLLGQYAEFGFLAVIATQSLSLGRLFAQTYDRAHRLGQRLGIRNQLLRKKNRALRQMDAQKDEFLAGVAHELQTPLQAILEGSKRLRSQSVAIPEAPDTIASLELIHGSAYRLGQLVKDVLDHQRLGAGELEVRPELVDVHLVAKYVLDLHRGQAASQVRLLNRIRSGKVFVHADPDRLIQVISNLVSNAIKNTASGSVRLRAIQSEEEVIVSVRDTGRGIPESEQDEIFLPYRQSGRQPGGTGLGLSIVRRLMRIMKGRIALRSSPGKGADFRLHFSAPGHNPDHGVKTGLRDAELRVDAVDLSVERSSIAHPLREFAAKTGLPENVLGGPPAFPTVRIEQGRVYGNPEGPAILIVDDEWVNQHVILNQLAESGFALTFADSTALCRELLARGTYEVLLLDVMLPEETGISLCQAIRENHSPVELPVILMTVRNANQDLAAGLNSGANDYLLRPVDGDLMERRIRNMLEFRSAELEKKEMQKDSDRIAEKERLRIFSDLHDHLGARLTDAELQLRRILETPIPDRAEWNSLADSVRETARVLRQRLEGLEDQTMLEEDYIYGLRLMLVRRYSQARRQIQFEDATDPEAFRAPEQMSLRKALYSIVTEVSTNDLKYGHGTSHWSFETTSHGVRMQMHASTDYQLSRSGTGNGTSTIQRRAAALGATVHTELGRNYSLSIQFPKQE
ncbi:MAG: response regulator [Leptospiraceae bacterium]|nr:response regulator [Leptospiraceae bacterium]